MRPAMLRVEGLSSHYGRVQALRNVSLSVNAGEIVALVGANGAGKTTLLRSLSGVQPVSGGRVIFDGTDITTAKPHARVIAGISQSPEGRQVFSVMSVEDNLRLGAYRRKDERIATDMDRVFVQFPVLKDFRSRLAGDLSGGQQQMLAIGRALMAAPRLLLLDEPSMGLAPILVDQILEAIVGLKDQGITIFLVEQNAFAALLIADRGYVLETGNVVASATGRELLMDERVKEAYLGI